MRLSEIEFKDIVYQVVKAPDDASPESMIFFNAPPMIDGMGMILVLTGDGEAHTKLIGFPPNANQEEGEKFCHNFIHGLIEEAIEAENENKED